MEDYAYTTIQIDTVSDVADTEIKLVNLPTKKKDYNDTKLEKTIRATLEKRSDEEKKKSKSKSKTNDDNNDNYNDDDKPKTKIINKPIN